MKIEVSQKQFDNLIYTMNHRLTKVEADIKWMKWILYYNAVILTAAIAGVFIL